jgi:hypothetical protein
MNAPFSHNHNHNHNHADAAVLEDELAWAAGVIEASIKLYFGHECGIADVRELHAPALEHSEAAYARLLREHGLLGFDARVVLILALAPHLRPQLLDHFLMRNVHYERGFTEFGGLPVTHGGFQPTVETAAFVLCGENVARRLELLALFQPGQPLRRAGLLELDDAKGPQGLFASPLAIHPQQLGRLTTGADFQPEYSPAFPARRLETALDWDELVLNDSVMDEVEEIRAWIEHRDTLFHDWQLARHVKPGFRSLFYGPPGTGKTLTACLLGKVCGRDVYRIDLSMVVSKYIGETEKNLGRVFDYAQGRNWILFFDEADALFGKRTQTSSSNDRYANQEVAYLLQRVEDFDGVVILATNLKSNIDEAFARRFQSMVYFPMPDADEREALWRQAFVQAGRLAPDVDLVRLAREHEISGAAVSNVARHAALMALRRGSGQVGLADLRQGIQREMRKEGKIM